MKNWQIGKERYSYLFICPPRSNSILILERKSGSWVDAVYVVAAFGMRTGVVGPEDMISIIHRPGVSASGLKALLQRRLTPAIAFVSIDNSEGMN